MQYFPENESTNCIIPCLQNEQIMLESKFPTLHMPPTPLETKSTKFKEIWELYEINNTFSSK